MCQVLREVRDSPFCRSHARGFITTGVLVMHKVLLTSESPKDVAESVLSCKTGHDEGTATNMFPCTHVRYVVGFYCEDKQELAITTMMDIQ